MNFTNIVNIDYLLELFINDINNITSIIEYYMKDDSVISSDLFCKNEPTIITKNIVLFLIVVSKILFLYIGYKILKLIFKNFNENKYEDDNYDSNSEEELENNNKQCNLLNYFLKILVIYFLIKWYQIYLFFFNINIT